MKIAFVTTQSLTGSTIIGRVLPLAEELAQKNEVHVLVHKFSAKTADPPNWRAHSKFYIHFTGQDPFRRTPHGKKRFRGLALITRLKLNAMQSSLKLISLKPDVIIIIKSLPENVLATRLASLIKKPKKIILDVDDFELTANQLTSLTQRAAVHWAQRAGSKLADHIVTATPFLSDHFEQLTQSKKPITMIPTGIHPLYTPDVYKGEKTLIYAGSLSLSSGHRVDLLPEILSQVQQKYPDIRLHMYGDGDDLEKLKRMFAEKGLENSVVWHGRFNSTSPFRPGEIFLDPIDDSITNRAKSSFRVLLAATLGLPVVASDIGIRPYLLPDRLHPRCFAKSADATDYAQKIIGLFDSPLSQTDQELLRSHATQFSWLHLAEEYTKIMAST